jgi:hypothetical protein
VLTITPVIRTTPQPAAERWIKDAVGWSIRT